MRAERIKAYLSSWGSWLQVWGVDLAVALIGLWIISSEFPRTLPGQHLADLGSMIASGQAARDGVDPYGVYPPLTFHVFLQGFESWNRNLNPPVSALVFQVFTLAEPQRIFRIWYVANVLLYATTVVLLWRRYKTAPGVVLGIWAFALAGFWETLGLGQFQIPLVLAAAGAWLLLERGATGWAGLLIGLLVAFKPQFAIWPGLLLLAGYRRPAFISVATAALLSAIPAAIFGPQVYQQWFAAIGSGFAHIAFLTNISVVGLTARADLITVGIVLTVALLAGAAAWAALRRPRVEDLSAVALLLGLIACPVTWVHSTVFLLPIVFAKWRRPGMRVLAAILMTTVPFVTSLFGRGTAIELTLGSTYVWALLGVFGLLVLDELRRGGVLTPLGTAARALAAEWAPRGPDFLLAAIAIAVIAIELPRTLPGAGLLDFGSFVASGQAARDGLNPYGVYPLTFRFGAGANPNLNPPISTLLFQAFSLTEVHRMFRIWYGVSVALYAAVIVLLIRRYKETPRLSFVLVACALAGIWETLVLGQIYIPLVLAAVGAWLLLERGWMNAAGILIGMIVAMKPNFAVWPALLFLSGRFRPAFVTGGTAMLISAIPLVVFGPEVYRQWFDAMGDDKGRPYFVTNAAITGLTMRADLPYVGPVVSLLLLGAAALWAVWRRPSIPEMSSVALLLSVLASPIGWVNYALFLLPVFCWRWSSPVVRVVLAMLMVPVPIVISELPNRGFRTVTLGSIYNWALLLLLGWIIVNELRKSGVLCRSNPPRLSEPAAASGPS